VLKYLPASTAYAMGAEDSFTPAMPKRDLHATCEKLEEARQIAMKAGVDVVTHLVETDDIESIIKSISETGADLLVIGTHKPQPDLSSPWSGTAYDLAQHAPCSVLDFR